MISDGLQSKSYRNNFGKNRLLNKVFLFQLVQSDLANSETHFFHLRNDSQQFIGRGGGWGNKQDKETKNYKKSYQIGNGILSHGFDTDAQVISCEKTSFNFSSIGARKSRKAVPIINVFTLCYLSQLSWVRQSLGW